MNYGMPSEAAEAWPYLGQEACLRQVAVIVQDRTMHREALDVLSGLCDVMVFRQARDLIKDPPVRLNLVLMDSATLLALGQAAERLQDHCRAPVLALVDEAHLQTMGPLLAEQVQDFLVRPFTATELLLRVKGVLRRFRSAPPNELTAGDFRIDLRVGEVYQGERLLPLTRKEVALLGAMARRMGETVTRDDILSEVWGVDHEGISNVLDVHIRSLRRKIETDPANPRHIITVRGIGYRFASATEGRTLFSPKLLD